MECDRPQSEDAIRCIIKYIDASSSIETEYVAFILITFFVSYEIIIAENPGAKLRKKLKKKNREKYN